MNNDYMNEPITEDYQAKIESDGKQYWVVCPMCGKKQFPLTIGAVIKGQMFQCKGSKCKQLFEVNFSDD